MRILILGATGSIGRHLVPQALERGHEVTAMLRDPASLAARPGLRILAGDALRPEDVDQAVQGQDAVIYSLGRSQHRKPTTMFSDSTRLLLRVMERHQVRRLVAITGIGAGESRGHGGFLYDCIIFPFITRRTYEDKDRQEALIRASTLDWVIVRPASFTDAPPRGSVRVATDLAGVTMKSISRADTASFVLDQLTSDEYLRKTPLIGEPE
jgi:putative NADH-flavin reductase